MLLALFAHLVGCLRGGTWQRHSLGGGGQGARPGCRATLVRQGTRRFARTGWQTAGFTAVSGA